MKKKISELDIEIQNLMDTQQLVYSADVKNIESDIIDEKEDEVLSRLNCGDTESTVCPLYNNEGPYHCSLYEGRSMVCRLFGFSCSEDKNHNLVWRACKWKEDKKEEIDATLLKSKRNDVPVMSEYGERLEECSDIEGESIYCAIPKAIWKLKMILQMTEDTPA